MSTPPPSPADLYGSDEDEELQLAIALSLADDHGPAGVAPESPAADTPAPADSHADAPVCSICLERVERGQSARALPCCHCFHTRCIDRWIRTRMMCLVCREPA